MSKVDMHMILKKNTEFLPQKPYNPLCFDLSVRNDLCMLDLRINANDTLALNAISKSLKGLNLPLNPFTSVQNTIYSILWLSTDQWLIVASEKQSEELTQSLNQALSAFDYFSLCEVSHMRSVFRLVGRQAENIIHKGGSLDTTLPYFKDGFVKRMSFAEIPAIVHFLSCQKEEQMIDLYVFRSYANYVFEWLNQTGHKDAAL